MYESGGNCLKYLKRGGGTEKRGGEIKILKRGVKLGQGVGALKRGTGTPLRTMTSFSISLLRLDVGDTGQQLLQSRQSLFYVLV